MLEFEAILHDIESSFRYPSLCLDSLVIVFSLYARDNVHYVVKVHILFFSLEVEGLEVAESGTSLHQSQ